MILHCVYRIVNFRDGKMYVGRTVNKTNRHRAHFNALRKGRHGNMHLQNAFNKYGEDAFYFEIIECDIAQDEINDREIYWIAHFDSFKNGYNATPGGEFGDYLGLPCVWNGVEYKTRTEASRVLGIPVETVTRRANLGYISDADIKGKRGEFTWNGITYKNLKEAAIALNVAPETVYGWRNKGYTCDEEVNPIRCTWNGRGYLSIRSAADAAGVSESVMARRIKNGYSCDSDIPPKKKPCTWNNIQYSSVHEAALANGITEIGMRGRLRFGYTCDDDMPGGNNLPDQRKECVWDGLVYQSVVEAAKQTGLKEKSIRKWILEGHRSLPPQRKISCIWNGIVYESVNKAAQANGIARETMSERLKKGYTSDNDIDWSKSHARQ